MRRPTPTGRRPPTLRLTCQKAIGDRVGPTEAAGAPLRWAPGALGAPGARRQVYPSRNLLLYPAKERSRSISRSPHRRRLRSAEGELGRSRSPPPHATAAVRHFGAAAAAAAACRGVGRRRVPAAHSAAEQRVRWPAEHREAPRTLAPAGPRAAAAPRRVGRAPWRAARRAMGPAAGA